ncbi:hypothetical protein GYMLUDRAFT_76206 [Collybiopsis luxurians FD-317 M1]|uniref:Uncharacterized protein n=1 Tax=Collybiopsis luxurians FD-317 M1 TaxID=944289 RepID=A0A0D0BMV7_9AGAR|nr:hypothetical protein GYMLUDRAFT_76206 [Collybiopsis luxurians FD-317 M1]
MLQCRPRLRIRTVKNGQLQDGANVAKYGYGYGYGMRVAYVDIKIQERFTYGVSDG